ncbi:amino acid kinase family protein [Gimesia panareensis]|uniref:Amino acid kinase family protein n=1 Tax=Gimesia panareensis TaxID=2527978 RepID=A0A517QCA9_9PLAN|nr:hypothetical protein [Gimesia panareensis]QDT29263.1 Amino acid kinase family protein [Gimesia panareensis]QDU52171.1 Amino acid kinase family protein [Gimesia panareensis]
MPIAVVKVGGSLFDLPDLGDRLTGLLAQLNGSRPLLISGGGRAADIVREWDRIHRLGETAAHWLAIQSLALNDRLLCELLPETRLVSSIESAQAVWSQNQIPVLSAYEYLTQSPSAGIAELPASWDVTSDSIAAWITLTWPADELILLKSVDLPEASSVQELSASGFVDPYLPELADALPGLRWCNLRSSTGSHQVATVTRGSSFQSRNATGPA